MSGISFRFASILVCALAALFPARAEAQIEPPSNPHLGTRLKANRAVDGKLVFTNHAAAMRKLQGLHKQAVGGSQEAQAEYAETLMSVLGSFMAMDAAGRSATFSACVEAVQAAKSIDGLESVFLSGFWSVGRQTGELQETMPGLTDSTLAAKGGILKQGLDLWNTTGAPSVFGGDLGVGYFVNMKDVNGSIDPFTGDMAGSLGGLMDQLTSRVGGTTTTVTVGRGGAVSQEAGGGKPKDDKSEKSTWAKFLDAIDITGTREPAKTTREDPTKEKAPPKVINFNEDPDGMGDNEATGKKIVVVLSWTPRDVRNDGKKPGGKSDGKPMPPIGAPRPGPVGPGGGPVAPKDGGISAPKPKLDTAVKRYNAFATAVLLKISLAKNPQVGQIATGFN